MKYRYTITHEGTVEADTPAEAEIAAFEDVTWRVTEGYGTQLVICEVEPLTRGTERDD